jgi:hypothetical protein
MASLPFATFSVQESPFIVRITINHDSGDDQDFRDIIQAIMKIFDFQKRVAVIIDASAIRVLTKQNMKDIRHFIRHNRPVFEVYLSCSSLIIRSVLIKNIINTIFKIQPPARPNLIVTLPEEAEQFIAGYHH